MPNAHSEDKTSDVSRITPAFFFLLDFRVQEIEP